jgi:deazaflavin-dependent oxidoreductase (nitroreductase family)
MDYNVKVIEEFRNNGGKVGGDYFAGMELLLLHSIGAKTGQERVSPVAYTMDGDKYVIIASKGGADTHPSWYYNLLAHPDTTVEVGDQTIRVHATEASGPEQERLYDQHAAQYPRFDEYRHKTSRKIPVFTLTKLS